MYDEGRDFKKKKKKKKRDLIYDIYLNCPKEKDACILSRLIISGSFSPRFKNDGKESSWNIGRTWYSYTVIHHTMNMMTVCRCFQF